MHLAADRTRHPSGVPARLGRVNGRHHRNIEEFGQGDRWVSHQPVVGVHHVGQPTFGMQAQSGPNHGVAHGQCPGHHVGAEIELVRILCRGDHPDAFVDLIGGRVARGVSAERLAGQHDDVVSIGGQGRRQVVHMPAQSADNHRRVLPRHHQDSHRGSRLASSAPNSPSARFQFPASRTAASRWPPASASAISRVAWACRCAR